MEIVVDRFVSDNDTTISKVSIDGKLECFWLEDEYRDIKVDGETRIPAGKYEIRLRTEGGFHNRYKNRFSSIHKGMLQIQNVPNFRYVLIHCGNTDEDTAGCLLVGTNANITEGEMSISSSRIAYSKFYPKVCDAAESGDLKVLFIDNDRI